MYYEKQPQKQQDEYKNMLQIVGSLSRLFSTSDTPYLHYRIHENIFSTLMWKITLEVMIQQMHMEEA